MNRIRIIGLAVMAAFALSVVAASAAQAAPEFVAESGGSVAGTKFIATGGEGKLAGTENITCKTSKTEGEIKNSTEVYKTVVTYTGCKNGTKECKSSSKAAAGEIKTNALSGKLGEVETSEAATGVGEDLRAESGKTFVTIEKCTLLSVSVTGSIIGEVTPIETFGTTGDLVYKASGTTQKIQKFKGGEKDTLEAFGSSALEDTYVVEFNQALKVTS